jgi:hypothetical protein
MMSDDRQAPRQPREFQEAMTENILLLAIACLKRNVAARGVSAAQIGLKGSVELRT